MKYENGYLLLEQTDIALLDIMMLYGVEKSFAANQFLSYMADCRIEATKFLETNPVRNDQTGRKALQNEMVRLYIEACDTLTEHAKNAMSEAGVVDTTLH